MDSCKIVISMMLIPMLLLVPSMSPDKVYYVTPSADDPCSTAVDLHPQCITLSQFAAKPSNYLGSNTTLILLPGTHMLNSVLNVYNRDSFVLTSQQQAKSNDSLISCNGTGRFEFKWVSYVRITALKFIGCGGNRILLSEDLAIESSMFWGKKDGDTAIEMVYVTNADILKTAFINNEASYITINQNLTLGGALILTESNVIITESSFVNNSAGVGGAIYGEFSHTSFSVINSTFIGNHASVFGGALNFQYVENSSILMYLKSNSTEASLTSRKPPIRVFGCHFSDNGVDFGGGAIAVYGVNLDISNSQFIGNWALQDGGVLMGENRLIINIDNCTFYKNFAAYGGVITFALNENVSVAANENMFFKNSAITGGVLLAEDGGFFTFIGNKFYSNAATDTAGAIVLLKNSTLQADTNIFFNNTATIGAVLYTEGPDPIHSVIKNSILVNNMINDSGGIIDVSKATFLTLENTQLINNSAKYFAGFIIDAMLSPTVTVINSTFVNNSVGASLIAVGESGTLHLFSSYFIENTGAVALVQIHDNAANIENCEFIDNLGSIYAFNSKVIFSGNNNFSLLSPASHTDHTVGGALTIIQSLFVFENESCTLLERNSAYNGGAIFATESSVYVHGQMTVTENFANNSGGGIYLYQSGLHCYGCTLHICNNTASSRGGGVQAISSAIKIYFNEVISHVSFETNLVTKGGAVSFESNGNLLIFQYRLHQSNEQVIYFKGNSAVYGGAIYINDDSSCLNSDYDVRPKESMECFFQIFSAFHQISVAPNHTTLNFEQNYAYGKGSVLFGGLLDRYTISHFAEIIFKCNFTDGTQPGCFIQFVHGANYITHTSNADIDSISSKPV